MTTLQSARFSVAPMMDWTDRHCRMFHRVLSREALLYTEMVTAAAVVRGGAHWLFDHDPREHPLALQLGGAEAVELAEATARAAKAGFSEVNLNVGCPSDRVQSGAFGAVLMTRPEVVEAALVVMQSVRGVEITVKCRIGVDDQDPIEVLPAFLERLRSAGVRRVIIHARKAWLKGLSPKENREVPPLDYPLVHAMKAQFPEMHLSVNGGISTLAEAKDHLTVMDGVMIGRAAYHDPYSVLSRVDQDLFGVTAAPMGRVAAAEAMIPYVEAHCRAGGRAQDVTRHMLGLFAHCPGARAWRRSLSETRDTGPDILRAALAQLPKAEAA